MHTNIKTFEDACTKLGLDAATVLPDFSMYPEKHRNAMIAHSKLVIIRDAVNDGWEPDWKNRRWDKWFPWFDHDSSSGSGLRSALPMTGARVRMPAPAFVSNLKRLQLMSADNLKTCTEITL